jgi:hypothetical protein
VQVRVDVALRAEQEDAALAGRVGRLQHRRVAHSSRGGACLEQRPGCRELRLRHAVLGKPPPHRDLVHHRVRSLRADSGQAQQLRGRGHDRHGPIGRDRQHAGDAVPPTDLRQRLDVGEVDHLGHVRVGQSGRFGVPVGGDDARPQLAHPRDRATLVPACADEEDGLHGARCYGSGKRNRSRSQRAIWQDD